MSGSAPKPPSSVHVDDRAVPSIEPAAGDDVERGRPLGDADRVVHLRHAHDGAVADADALGPRGDGGEEHLGRRAVRVLLEEVVLDRPHRVEAELVGQHRLLERVVVRLLLAGARQRRRHRQLEEDAELHRRDRTVRPHDRPMAEITHRFVDTNGIHMHIAEAGPADGPLVVLCHGFPESWYSWRHQIGALADAGYHVVAPDQRGYGQTDAPEAIDQYTQLHLVGDIIGLLDVAQRPHRGHRRPRLGRARRMEHRAAGVPTACGP